MKITKRIQNYMNVKYKFTELIAIIILAVTASTTTYYLNHAYNLGPFIASGLIGVIAASLLTPGFAAAAYTASFVGMSAEFVLPGVSTAALAGVAVGIIAFMTKPIFAGWGGKGGITAATAVLITLLGLNFFQ